MSQTAPSRVRAVPSWAVTLASVVLVLAAWTAVTSAGLVRDLFLPGPMDVWSGFTELANDGYRGRSLLAQVGASAIRVGVGFLTGAVAGTVLGLTMGYAPRVNAVAAPFIEFLRPLPQLAYLVLLIVWPGDRRDEQDHHAVPGRPASLGHRGAGWRASSTWPPFGLCGGTEPGSRAG